MEEAVDGVQKQKEVVALKESHVVKKQYELEEKRRMIAKQRGVVQGLLAESNRVAAELESAKDSLAAAQQTQSIQSQQLDEKLKAEEQRVADAKQQLQLQVD